MYRAALVALFLFSGCIGSSPGIPTPTGGTSGGTGGDPSSETTATPPVPIARGHIFLAGPYTGVRSIAVVVAPGVDGFSFQPPPAGSNVTTRTTNARGLGYDLSLNFHDSAGVWLGGCATSARDEVCAVPERAARGEVTAAFAIDVDGEVLLLAD